MGTEKVWHFKKPSLWKTQGKPITKPQITTLHKLKGVLHWDDAIYQAVIERHSGGKQHTNEMTRGQASAMIAEMLEASVAEKRQEKPTLKRAPKKSDQTIVVLANPMQRALIAHLIDEINWYEHGSYEAWLSKNMKLDKVVTKEQAGKVIEGLKGLKQHGHQKPTHT